MNLYGNQIFFGCESFSEQMRIVINETGCAAASKLFLLDVRGSLDM